MNAEIIIRDRDEIQRAHDMLVAYIMGEVPATQRERDGLCTLAPVLCWVLRHDHNDAFDKLLAQLEASAKEAGFELTRKTNEDNN